MSEIKEDVEGKIASSKAQSRRDVLVGSGRLAASAHEVTAGGLRQALDRVNRSGELLCPSLLDSMCRRPRPP
jgi:hypothetical protein